MLKSNKMNRILKSKETISMPKCLKWNVYSTLLFGAEAWTMYSEWLNGIKALEMSIYRRIDRIS